MSDLVGDSYKSIQKFRMFSILLILICHVTIIYFKGFWVSFKEQIKFLSLWSHNLTLMYFLVMWSETVRRKGMKIKIYETEMDEDFLNHLHSTNISYQFLCTAFYWAILYDPATFVDSFTTFHKIYYHLVPFILLTIEFFWNSLQMKFKHLKLLFILFFLFMVINGLFVFISGTPVYKALDFKGMGSLLFMFKALSITLFGFFLFKGLEFFKRKTKEIKTN